MGLIFFSSLKKEKGGGGVLPPFQHLAHVVSHDSSFSSLPLVSSFSCCISVPNLRFAPPFTLQPTPLFLNLKPPLFAPMIDHFFPHPVSTSYLKQFTYETHLIPFSSPQTRLNMRSLAALALLLHPLFHTHAHSPAQCACIKKKEEERNRNTRNTYPALSCNHQIYRSP